MGKSENLFDTITALGFKAIKNIRLKELRNKMSIKSQGHYLTFAKRHSKFNLFKICFLRNCVVILKSKFILKLTGVWEWSRAA